jgi:polysaccharide pyruvyl transferase WcaK-like protein
MTTLLTNAYSAKNSGDGLLVDESIAIVKEAGLHPSNMLALDPGSFTNTEMKILHSDISKYKFVLELYKGNLDIQASSINQAFAVGGGYLRFPSRKVGIKTYLSHLMQLKALHQNGIPFGMLPVSVGPINFFEKEVIEALRGARFIAVRDDKSFNELKMLSNVVRIPDLSILSDFSPIQNATSEFQVGLIIRDLAYEDWNKSVKMLSNIPNSFLMLQSSVGSNNNDMNYLRKVLPHREFLSTSDAFRIRRPSLVISSRLHGAIMSINQGIPAIHLGYERKSMGVFKDLGLAEFCLPAQKLDFPKLFELINRFHKNPNYLYHYFDRIEVTNKSRMNHRQELISLISGCK